MIEQLIIQVGALGIVGFVVHGFMKTTNECIKNNTSALGEVKEVMKSCTKALCKK